MEEGQLKELFSEFGEVMSAKIIVDKFTQRSRGFGFVEMPDDAANQAIATLNGKEVMGLALRVNEARPKTENSGGYGQRSRNYQSNNRNY